MCVRGQKFPQWVPLPTVLHIRSRCGVVLTEREQLPRKEILYCIKLHSVTTLHSINTKLCLTTRKSCNVSDDSRTNRLYQQNSDDRTAIYWVTSGENAYYYREWTWAPGQRHDIAAWRCAAAWFQCCGRRSTGRTTRVLAAAAVVITAAGMTGHDRRRAVVAAEIATAAEEVVETRSRRRCRRHRVCQPGPATRCRRSATERRSPSIVHTTTQHQPATTTHSTARLLYNVSQ